LFNSLQKQTQAEGRRDNAKLLLSSAPVLTAPRWNRPFHLKVNASGLGAGAALLQKDDNGID